MLILNVYSMLFTYLPFIYHLTSYPSRSDHTKSNAPDPFRTPKLSGLRFG